MRKGVLLAALSLGLMAVMVLTDFADLARAEEAKPIELKFAHFLPPVSARQKMEFEPWVKMIEERTGGKVKITIYPAGSLLKQNEIYDGVINNIAQIGFADIEGAWGRFPRTEVVTMPMAPWDKDERTANHLEWTMFAKGYISEEYKQVKMLGLISAPPQILNTSKKPVRTMADIKGMKIALAQRGLGDAFAEMGAIPSNILASDHYMAVQKGTVDATMFSWVGMAIFKILEVTKYHNATGFAIGSLALIMNQQTYDSFPPDVKKVFDELSGEWFSKFDADVGVQIDEQIITAAKGMPGQEINYLAPEEEAKWRTVSEGVWKKWAKDMDAKGFGGQKLLDAALQTSKEFKGWSLK